MTYFYAQNHIFPGDQFSTTVAVVAAAVAVVAVSTAVDDAIRLTLVLSLARLLLPFPVETGCDGVVVVDAVTSFPEDFRSLVVFRHDNILRRASSLERVSCFHIREKHFLSIKRSNLIQRSVG